ncbi:MAG: hypothetical protein ABWY64_22645 [Tardiphaga sp.]
MTNEIAKPNQDFFSSYGEQASQRSIVGKLLRFSKGEYTAGQQDEQVEEGTRFIANMDELLAGWIRWIDNKPTDQVMGRIAAGYQPPRRNELGDIDPGGWDVDNSGKPRDPWQFTNYLQLKAEEYEATEWDVVDESLFTFTTSSRGGLNAIGELCKVYGKNMRQRPNEFPIVAIGVDSYKHSNKEYGKIFVPLLTVVGWAPKSVFEAANPEKETPAIEAPPAQPKGKPAKAIKGKPLPVTDDSDDEIDPPHPKAAVISAAKGKARRF